MLCIVRSVACICVYVCFCAYDIYSICVIEPIICVFICVCVHAAVVGIYVSVSTSKLSCMLCWKWYVCAVNTSSASKRRNSFDDLKLGHSQYIHETHVYMLHTPVKLWYFIIFHVWYIYVECLYQYGTPILVTLYGLWRMLIYFPWPHHICVMRFLSRIDTQKH